MRIQSNFLRGRVSAVALAAVLVALPIAQPALAEGIELPTGGQVVAGQATFGGSGAQMVVNQTTQRAVIDWTSFSIGQGGKVDFNNGNGATLNRVTGGNPSAIAGQLTATGSLYLINPAGIVVDQTGKVLTGGSFIASTRPMDSESFLAGGDATFSGGSAAGVENKGSIEAGGDVVLIGSMAVNSGSIAAGGSAGLLAGDHIVLRSAGADQRMMVDLGEGDVTNTGTISAAAAELRAAGGNVFALAGNNGGLINATGGADRGGRAWLVAGKDVTVAGQVKAKNADGTGGTVHVLGANIALKAGSDIDASGSKGGIVLVGGDYKGGSDATRRYASETLKHASTVNMASAAKINVSGTAGDGGAAVLWSDDVTRAKGRIDASATRGDGGFIETSSHGYLDFDADVTTASATGANGLLLLDPASIVIGATADIDGANSAATNDLTAGDLPLTTGSYAGAASQIKATTVASLLGTTDVSLAATGNITVSSAISKTTGSTAQSLTLNAGGAVAINAGISNASGSTGALTLNVTGGTGITQSGALSGGTGRTLNVNYTATTGDISTSAGIGATGGGLINLQAQSSTGSISIGGLLNTSVGGAPITLTAGKDVTFTGANGLTTAGAAGTNVVNITATNGAISVGSGVFTLSNAAMNMTAGTTITLAGTGSTTVQVNGGTSSNGVTFTAHGSNGTVITTGNVTSGANSSITTAGTSAKVSFIADGTNASMSLGSNASGSGGTSISATGTVTQTGALTTSNGVQLLGSGTYQLTNSSNAIPSLAGTVTGAGSVAVLTSGALSIGTVFGTAGLTTPYFNAVTNPTPKETLLKATGGAITQTAAGIIAGYGLGATASTLITLANTGNAVTGNVALVTTNQAIQFANGNSATTVGNVSARSLANMSDLSGINSGTAITSLSSTGTVGQTSGANIIASGLQLLGSGGAYTLTSTGNDVDTIAASTGKVAFTDKDDLSTGQVASSASNLGFGVTTNGITTTATSAASTLNTTDFAVDLQAGAAGTFDFLTVSGTNGNISTGGNGNVRLVADGMAITGTINVSTTAGRLVNLTTTTSGRQILFGGSGADNDDPTGANATGSNATGGRLKLDTSELGKITADITRIGSATAGQLYMLTAFNSPTNTLSLWTGAGVSQGALTVGVTNYTGGALSVNSGAGKLAIRGTGNINLEASGNSATKIAINSTGGNVRYQAAGNVDLDSVDAIDTSVVTPGGLLALSTASGNVTQSQAIQVDNLRLGNSTQTGGTYTLTNAANIVGQNNDITTGGNAPTTSGGVAIRAATVSLASTQGYVISTVDGLSGLTATTATLSTTDATSGVSHQVTQSQAISATTLNLNGTGGRYRLGTQSNTVGTLTANTGTIDFNNAQALTVGTVTTDSQTVANGVKISALGGNLTLDGTITAANSSTTNFDRVVLFTNRDFVATANANINPGTGSNRFLVYTNNPNRAPTGTGTAARDDTTGEWNFTSLSASANASVLNAGHVYNNATNLTTANRTATAVTPTGNRFVYADQPTLIYKIEATTTKTYDGTAATPAVTLQNGLINAGANGYSNTNVAATTNGSTDTNTNNAANINSAQISGAAAYSQTLVNVKHVGNDPDAAVTSYTGVTASQGTLASGIGYAFAFDNTTTNTTTINPKGLTVDNASAQNKIYDGTTVAQIDLTNATLNGKVGADTVGIAALTGVFASKDVANGITVTPGTPTLTGADRGNYTVGGFTNPATLTANITKRDLTIRAVTDTKTYDGNTSSSGVPTVDAATATTGLVLTETLSGTQTFNTAAASATNGDKTLTVTSTTGGNGFLAANYTINTVTATGTINKKSITATGVTANNRIYDSTNAATFSGTPTVSTGVTGETFDVTTGTGTFSTVNVGNGLTVTATGFALTNPGGGASASNYTFNQPTGLTANITVRPVTIRAVTATKTYDGNTTAAGTPTVDATVAGVSGLVGGNTITGRTQAFASKDANGTNGSTITVTGYTVNDGNSGNNYSVTAVDALGTINKKAITATGITADNKIYDSTTADTFTGTAVVTTGVTGETFDVSAGTVAFGDKNVGTGKTVTASGFALTNPGGGASASNYTFAQPTGLSANITVRTVTINAVTSSKTYDGNTSSPDTPTVATANATTGLVGGDSITGRTQVFNSKDASATNGDKTLTVNAYTVNDGNSGNNYNVVTNTATGTINKKTITATGITAQNKVYDGNTSDTFTGTAVVSTGVTGETFDVSAGTVAFGDKNVGTGKTVTATGFALTNPGGGASAANYTFAQPTGLTANITAKTLTVNAVTDTKAYDGTTASAQTISAVGLVGGDTTSTLSQTFDSKDASAVNGRTLTVGSFTVSDGNGGNNYSISSATALGTINKKTIGVTGATANNKVYDGLTTATLSGTPVVSTGVTGETFTVNSAGATGTFADKNVANAIAVTATGYTLGTAGGGALASNYTIAQPTGLSANITKATLTVTAQDKSKTYDNNAATDPALTFSVAGLVNGETVSTGLTGGYTGGGVGNGVAVTSSTALAREPGQNVGGGSGAGGKYVISNTGASPLAATGNYALSFTNGLFDITAAGISLTYVVGDSTYVYGNSPVFGSAAFNANTYATLTGVVGGDDVQVLLGNLNVYQNDGTTLIAAANAVTGTTLNASGTAYKVKPVSLTLGGSNANNYVVTDVGSTAGNVIVTARPITVTGITADNKVYDNSLTATVSGTPTISTGVAGQTFAVDATGASAAFATKNVANGITVTATGYALGTGGGGAMASNYSIQQPTGLSANITARPITITAATSTKTYDGNTSSAQTPTLTAGTLATGESLNTLSQTFNTAAASATNGDKTLTVATPTFSAGSASNYAITLNTAAGTINRKSITVTGATANNKVYDNSTVATLGGTPVVSTGVGSETFTVDASGATGTFADKNVATGIAVTATGYTLGTGANGAVASNYNIVQPTGLSADITLRPITITAATSTKTYDGTTASANTPTITSGSLATGESFNTLTQTFNTASASATAGDKTLTAATPTFNVGTSSNYSITLNTNTGTINKKTITATGITADNKVYDGGTTDTFSGTAVVSTGVTGETFDVTPGTVAFGNKNVGTGKTVTATGFALTNPGGGASASNYTFAQPTGLSANITARTLMVNAVTDTRVYNGTTSSAGTVSVSGLQTGDTTSTLTQTFDSKNVSAVNGRTLTVGSFTISDGNGGNNYSIVTNTALGTITAKSVSITGLSAQNKVYDGGTVATLTGGSLSGAIGGDSISFGGGSGAFASKNVANGIGVTVTGYGLTGGDASNYTLSGQPTGLTANITPKALAASLINTTSKVYDGNTQAALTASNYSLTGFVAGESASVTQPDGTYDSKNVGTGKTVTATLLGGNYTPGGGTTLSNYTLPTSASGAIGTITAKAVTVTGISAQNKVFDGTTSATLTGGTISGTVPGDNVAVGNGTGTFDTRNVGTGKTVTFTGGGLTGTDAGNYTFTPPTGLTANITPATLNITPGGVQRVYGSTDPAGPFTVTGLGTGDTASIVTGALGRQTGQNVGSYNWTLGTLNAGGNYTLALQPGTGLFVITPKPLMYQVTNTSFVYGNLASPGVATLTGVVAGDTVGSTIGTTTSGGTPVTFATNTGVGVYNALVTGLTGASAANYSLASTGNTPGTVTITPATLTITPQAASKVYGSADPTLPYAATGFVAGDTASVLGGALGRAAGQNAGNYAYNLGTLTGGGNYVLAAATTTNVFSITPKAINYSIADSANVYGTQGVLGPISFTGLVGTDTLSATLQAKTAAGQVVTLAPNTGVARFGVTPVTLTGVSAGNYVLATTGNRDGTHNVTPAPLNIAIADATKVFGTPNPTFTYTVTGLVAGDTAAALIGTTPSGTGTNGVVVQTTAGTDSPAGLYPITTAGQLANYTVTVVPGTLAVTASVPAPVTPVAPGTSGGSISATGLNFTNSTATLTSLVGNPTAGGLTTSGGFTDNSTNSSTGATGSSTATGAGGVTLAGSSGTSQSDTPTTRDAGNNGIVVDRQDAGNRYAVYIETVPSAPTTGAATTTTTGSNAGLGGTNVVGTASDVPNIVASSSFDPPAPAADAATGPADGAGSDDEQARRRAAAGRSGGR